MFLGGEYNERSEFFGANEDDVASSPNLEDLHWKEASPIGCSSWHKKECNLLNLEGVFLARGCVIGFDSREAILDDSFGDDHAAWPFSIVLKTF